MSADPVPAVYIDEMLQDAYVAVIRHVHTFGDGLLAGGEFVWNGPGGMVLRTANANNRQQTYGVLAAALRALHDWMSGRGGGRGFGAADFNVYDGGVEVGMGAIG